MTAMTQIAGQRALPDRESAGLSVVLVIVFFAIAAPIFFSVGSLFLSTSRVIFLFLVPVLLVRLFAGHFGRLVATDFFVLFFVFWLAVSIFLNNPNAFVTFVGSNALIILGGYLTARAYIRSAAQFSSFIKLFGITVACSLPFAIYETLTSNMILAGLIDAVPGVSAANDVNYGRRLSLFRVQLMFTHPIHYGLFCSMAFSLAVVGLRQQVPTGRRLLWGTTIGICCFLSISSGPFLALMLQVGLASYAALTQRMQSRWGLLMGSGVGMYLLLELLSDRPAYLAIVTRLTFSTHTAYVRQTLLDYGLQQVARTPVFGVGYNEWDLPSFMSGSTDNFWLMTALIYGVPSFLALLGAFLYTMIRASRSNFAADTHMINLRRGWIMMMTGMMFCLATVAIWSEVMTFTFLLIGCGVWMIHAKVEEPADTETDAAATTGARYSRFQPRPGPARTAS